MGVTGNTFNPLVADTGTITITYSYTDMHGCSNTKTQNIVVSSCSTTGINQLANNNDINIYPNPAQNSITISGKQLAEIQITDMLGNILIKNEELKMKNGIMQIDISNLQSGVYFLRVGNAMQKFIKE